MFSKSETPNIPEELPRYIGNELSKLESESRNPKVNSIQFTVHYSEPDKPRTGQVYYADGTEWDPGSGEGLYYFNSSSAWVKL